MVTLESQLLYFDVQKHFWKKQTFANIRQLQPSNLCHKMLDIQGRGRGQTRRKRKELLGSGWLRKKMLFPIFWLVVCLLAASQGRGTSFLFSLQANTHWNCPSLLFFYGGDNHGRHHAASPQSFRLSATLAHSKAKRKEKQSSMHTLARCPSVPG